MDLLLFAMKIPRGNPVHRLTQSPRSTKRMPIIPYKIRKPKNVSRVSFRGEMANPKAETAVADVWIKCLYTLGNCYRKLNVNVCRNSNLL
jgi:hypothetical protein